MAYFRINDAKTYPILGFDSMSQSRESILRRLRATETVSDYQMAVSVLTFQRIFHGCNVHNEKNGYK